MKSLSIKFNLGGNMARILTVDDSKVIRELVQAVLIENKHSVVTADDGV